MHLIRLLYIFTFILLTGSNNFASQLLPEEDHLSEQKEQNEYSRASSRYRYILYDVNHGEGFNLRRDVFMRMAALVRMLDSNYKLVLPLWVDLPHWKKKRIKKKASPERVDERWSSYFDVSSINSYVPVIEFDDFLHHTDSVQLILALDHFPDTFKNGQSNWHEHYALDSNCTTSKYHVKVEAADEDGQQEIVDLRGVEYVKYLQLACVHIEGTVSTLKQLIKSHFSEQQTILITNAEVILHSDYGNALYWQMRRSMRFSDILIQIGNKFRKEKLDSIDETDKTVTDMKQSWREIVKKHGDAIGGEYLSAHLRRGDFAKSRKKNVPDMKCAIKQIKSAVRQFVPSQSSSPPRVFIASDADQMEWKELEEGLSRENIEMVRFTDSSLSDGQVAIIDQWIAAHGRIFIGTYDSTFSFRIQEEREILGFLPNTTFNAFCSKCDDAQSSTSKPFKLCKQESQWKIVYDES